MFMYSISEIILLKKDNANFYFHYFDCVKKIEPKKSQKGLKHYYYW